MSEPAIAEHDARRPPAPGRAGAWHPAVEAAPSPEAAALALHPSAAASPGPAAAAEITVSRGGAPLDAGMRAFFEARFGAPLSGMRVHTGPEADRAARGLDALAFTVGRDVAFRAGAYAPGTAEGRRLLGHELAHALQARRAPDAEGVSSGGEAAEAEARQAGEEAAAGLPARVVGAPAARVQRERLADAPASERRRLVGVQTRLTLSPDRVAGYFERNPRGTYVTRLGPPDGATVVMAGIDPTYLVPMTSVAAHLAQTRATGEVPAPVFEPGITLNVHLQLARFGLEDAAYRFSWTGDRATGTIHIEPASGATPRRGSPATEVAEGTDAPAGTEIRVGAHRFILSSHWTADRFADLLRALAIVPESALARVDGMRFRMGTGPAPQGEDGHYDEVAHEAVIFSNAWRASDIRSGTVGGPIHAVIHEIGHAVDRAPLRRAWAAREADPERARGDRAALPARSESGSRYERAADGVYQVRSPLRGTGGDFRRAAARDGVALPGRSAVLRGGPTRYSNESWEEMYAESFAMYASDPELLRLIRPNLYAYFHRLHP